MCVSMGYLRNINVYVLEYEQQNIFFGCSSLQLLFAAIGLSITKLELCEIVGFLCLGNH